MDSFSLAKDTQGAAGVPALAGMEREDADPGAAWFLRKQK